MPNENEGDSSRELWCQYLVIFVSRGGCWCFSDQHFSVADSTVHSCVPVRPVGSHWFDEQT